MKKILPVLLALILLSGCVQQGSLQKAKDSGGAKRGSFEIVKSTSASKEKAPQGTAPKPIECPKEEPKRIFDAAPYYEGPLIDAHLHMPSLFSAPPGITEYFNPAVLGRDVTMAQLVCLLEREKITKAIGFFLVLDFLQGSSLQVPLEAQKNYPGKLEPFLMPAPLTRPTLSAQEYQKIVDANPGLFKGYGELAFYFGVFRGTSPDDPRFMEIFKAAQTNGHIVMIHPTPETIEGLEIAIQKNPDLIFLLHGEEVDDEIMPLVEKYANVYFTLDTRLVPGLYSFDSAQDFKADFRKNFNSHLEKSIAKWKPRIEANPGSFVWGTDRGEPWHFDEEVGDYIAETGRAFIGRLSPEVQEKFSYRNAQNLLAGKKTGTKAPVAPITKSPFTGMEGLCASEEKCGEFCMNNRGRCNAYCEKNPGHALCRNTSTSGSGEAPVAQENTANGQPPGGQTVVSGAGTLPVLSNMAFEIAPWDRSTNMAGDLVFTRQLLYNDGRVSNDKVFVEFGHSDNSRPGEPWVENWFFVPLGTKVRAPAAGIARVDYFEHTKDWGVNIEQDAGWTVSLEHLVNVGVKSGDRVKAGDILGEAAPRSTFKNEIAMTELAVWKGGAGIVKYCPFNFLDESIKPVYKEKLERLAKDWEEFVGEDVYEEQKWVVPGCLMDKIVEK